MDDREMERSIPENCTPWRDPNKGMVCYVGRSPCFITFVNTLPKVVPYHSIANFFLSFFHSLAHRTTHFATMYRMEPSKFDNDGVQNDLQHWKEDSWKAPVHILGYQ